MFKQVGWKRSLLLFSNIPYLRTQNQEIPAIGRKILSVWMGRQQGIIESKGHMCVQVLTGSNEEERTHCFVQFEKVAIELL